MLNLDRQVKGTDTQSRKWATFVMLTDSFERFDQQEQASELYEELDRYEPVSLLCAIGHLQLLPSNASLSFALNLIANLVVAKPNPTGQKASTKVVGALIHRLLPKLIMHQDPPCNRFVEEVGFGKSTFKCFPDYQLGGCSDFQQMIKASFYNPNFGTEEFRIELCHILRWGLVLSDLLAERAELEAGFFEPKGVKKRLKIPKASKSGRSLHSYFGRELLCEVAEAYNIPLSYLSGFVAQPAEGPLSIEDGPLQRGPLVPLQDGYLVPVPSGLWLSSRRQMLDLIVQSPYKESFVASFAEAVAHTASCTVSNPSADQVDLQFPIGVSMRRFFADSDKVCSVVIIVDNLTGWDSSKPDSGVRTATSDELISLMKSGLPGFDEDFFGERAFFVLVHAGFGRVGIDGFGAELPSDIGILSCHLFEFQTMMRLERGDLLSLLRFSRQFSAFREDTKTIPLNTTLDFYDLFRKDRTFYLSDDKKPDFFLLHFDANRDTVELCQEQFDICWREHYSSDIGAVLTERRAPYENIYRCSEVRDNRLAYWAQFWVVTEDLSKKQHLANTYEAILVAITYWLNEFSNFLAVDSPDFAVKVVLESPESWFVVEDECLPTGELSDCFRQLKSGSGFPGLNLSISENFRNFALQPGNAAELALVEFILTSADVISDPEGLDKAIATNGQYWDKKMLLLATVDPRFSTINPGNLSKARTVPRELHQQTLDYLGERLSEKYPQGNIQEDKRNELLKDCVAFLFGETERLLSEVDRGEALKRLVELNEALRFEHANTQSIKRYELACFPGLSLRVREHAERISNLATAAAANRFLLEYLGAQRKHSGTKPLTNDLYDTILAYSSQLISCGSFSDLLHFEIADCQPRLLPSGRLDFGFWDYLKKQEDFTIAYHMTEFKKIKSTYEERFDRSFDSEFEAACVEEWGYSFEQLVKVFEAMNSLLEPNKEVASVEKSDLVAKIATATGFDVSIVSRVIEDYTLPTRDKFMKPPKPYRQEDTYPWRVRRPLSYLRKPILSNEAELVWGRRNLFVAGTYILQLLDSGRYQPQSEAMARFQGKLTLISGKNFVDRVASELEQNGKVMVKVEFEKFKGKKIAGDDGQPLGDIDVLGFHIKKREVWALECKAYEKTLAPHEIKQAIDKICDETDGTIVKHRKRATWLKKNLKDVLVEFGLDSGKKKTWQVRTRILVNHESFVPRTSKLQMKIETWDSFKARFGL